MGSFSKSKNWDKKGESIVDKIGELSRKAIAVSEADTGGSEAVRLRRAYERISGELEQTAAEFARVSAENKAIRAAFKKAATDFEKFKRQTAEVEELAKKVKSMIRKYGELEAGLDKAIEKALNDLGKIQAVEIEMPEDLNL
jgi:predicted nuclease with TOPRIM domain